MPFPKYPTLHVQENDPFLFPHAALVSQLSVLVSHSSISLNNKVTFQSTFHNAFFMISQRVGGMTIGQKQILEIFFFENK